MWMKPKKVDVKIQFFSIVVLLFCAFGFYINNATAKTVKDSGAGSFVLSQKNKVPLWGENDETRYFRKSIKTETGNIVNVTTVSPLNPVGKDPEGDNLIIGGQVVDIVHVDAASNSFEVTIKINFSPNSTHDFINNLRGFILLDTDQNPSTGDSPISLFGKDTQSLGFDYHADLQFLPEINIWKTNRFVFTLAGTIVPEISGNSFSITVPLSMLGNDDGAIDITLALGDLQGPTDWAPDSGKYTINGSTGASTPEVCSDGRDNDLDGLTDCDDPDCLGDASCVVAPVAEAGFCGDGIDNDNDGLFDCDDADCASDATCAASTNVLVADFNASPLSGIAPLLVTFTDFSISTNGSVVSWQWDFGDGFFVSNQNPTHEYRVPGFYTVSLTVKDSLSGFASVTKPDFIVVNQAGKPVADFTASSTKGVRPFDAQFTDLSSSPNGAIRSWFWEFGDGATGTDQHPVHTYTFSGFFTVSLEIFDTLGELAFELKPNFIFVDDPGQPTADFTASPTTGLPVLNTQFTDLSTSPNGAITSWFWDFGDGRIGIQQHPLHKYEFPGFFSVALEVGDIAGEFGFTNKPNMIVVKKPQPPVADFSASQVEGFAPFDTQFTDLSTSPNGNIAGWDWDFGDGFFSSDQHPAHTYKFDGIYGVGLEVKDVLGEFDFVFKSGFIKVEEKGAPVADFSVDKQAGPAPLKVAFTDKSTSPNGAITKRSWSFGNGLISPDQDPTHIYDFPGFYSVELVVNDVAGKEASIFKPNFIFVSQPGVPAASFSATPESGQAPLFVQFTDNSTSPNGAITSRSWDFGDGDASNDQNPDHVYNFQGFYTVALEVFDTVGKSSFVTKPGFIEVTEGSGGTTGSGKALFLAIRTPFDPTFAQHPNRILVPFKANSPDFPVNLGVIDRNTGKFLENVSISALIDDTTIAGINPAKALTLAPVSGSIPGAQFKIKPAKGGVTSLLFEVVDPDDENNVLLRKLSVEVFCLDSVGRAVPCPPGGGPVVEPTPDETAPNTIVAEFIGDPTSGFAPLDVQFVDKSTGNVTNWAWEFGDGGVNSDQNPEYTYKTAGIFTVKLTASGPNATDSETKTNYVNAIASGGATAEFSADPTTGFSPLTVKFRDLSVGQITSWAWTFGDGGISSEQNPVNTYKTSGFFTVGLTVSGSGQSDTEIKTNLIAILEQGAPKASFSASPTAGRVPLTVQFSDVSQGDITSWSWEFGDGGVSKEQNPTHVFRLEGFYTVNLTVGGSKGADKESKTNLIIAEGLGVPIAEFSATPTAGDEPLEVKFTDLSQPNGLIESWTWDFGDGATSSEQNPTHKYLKGGFYTVKLTVSNSGGADSETKNNLINVIKKEPPTAEFSATPQAGEVPTEVTFTDLSEPRGDIDSWVWDFGDGGTSSEQNPKHTYNTEGVFSISLTVSNENGIGVETKTNLITIKNPPAPQANFAAAPTSGRAPLEVSFQDLSSPTGKIKSWLWDFGDGGSSDEQNPKHTYQKRGKFTVSLTVSNSGGFSTETKRRLIKVKRPSRR